MPDKKNDQTPFDELVSEDNTPPVAGSTPRHRSWNIFKFLNAVPRPSPARLPTSTLVGLSMTAGALLVLVSSILLQSILPRPQSRFNVPVPVAVKPRAVAPALVEIKPSNEPRTVATAPPAVSAVHSAPSPIEADVIKDPQEFEFEQKVREQRRQENEKIAEARKLEDQKILEQRKLEDQKLLEQQRLEEDQRLAAERKLEDEKVAEQRRLEDQQIAEARQLAEQRKLEADQKLAEIRKAEDQRHAEQRKLEDEKLLQQRQNEDQQGQRTSKL